MISARTASPSRSMDVTSISSTMHLRVSPARRASLQRDLSSAAHSPTSRPCKDHLCSSDKSAMVIFSTTLPRRLPDSLGHDTDLLEKREIVFEIPVIGHPAVAD